MTLLEFMGQHPIFTVIMTWVVGLDTSGYRKGTGRKEMKRFIMVFGLAFVFGQQVKVIRGFYSGCTGAVLEHREDNIEHREWAVALECRVEGGRRFPNAFLKTIEIEAVKK
jgi:hypothetical protein